MDRGLSLKKIQGLFSKTPIEGVWRNLSRRILNQWPGLDWRERRGELWPPIVTGGEQLLVGVVQSGEIMPNSWNQRHGEQEEMIANSPRRIGTTIIGWGRHAATNGGRRNSAHTDRANLVKQIEKEEKEELYNFQTATRIT
jgi:hypothetical protein